MRIKLSINAATKKIVKNLKPELMEVTKSPFAFILFNFPNPTIAPITHEVALIPKANPS
ncbi:hypothetical protein I6U48_11155 [Clostridium sp. PL3]|uniref:Uncharacterized protein n=1 Tax=Clostridium thailandense TaxID=2794346 RepID=A0A949TJJ1_9CLOT|nr:hypothetical protein [Clostridium thailandense]MBV7273465.1 hypothetical protein [Clostridium thailandense]